MAPTTRNVRMSDSNSEKAKQVAMAACAFEQETSGRAPKSVTVVLINDTVMITLREMLSPAEKELAKTSLGAAQVQEFHRVLFASNCESLRLEIEAILNVGVREAASEVATGTGTVVHVFLLTGGITAGDWTG
jgi:uncharacterized protein YbcI